MMGILVQINAAASQDQSSVNATGSLQYIITDVERAAYGIEDAALKAAVAAYFGKAPNDAYVCSPTPWGDLYTTYGWPQVQVTMVPQSATILGLTSNPVALATQSFTNNSSVSATYNCSLTHQVTTTAESSWSTTSTLEAAQSISYGIEYAGANVGGETSLSFSQAWESGGSQSESITIGTNTGVSFNLDPGQSALATLSASVGVLTVQVVYTQSLAGCTALNYDPTYNGHHFWALDLPTVMASSNLASSQQITETITISYYSNASIVLTDGAGNVRATFPMSARPGPVKGAKPAR